MPAQRSKFAAILTLTALSITSAYAGPIALPQYRGLQLRYEGRANRNTISGTASRSFLSSGLKFTHETALGWGGELTRGLNVDLSLEGRSTNDPLVTTKLSEVSKYMVRLSAPDHFSVDLGNRVFSNFSQYSLTRSLEGVQIAAALPFTRPGSAFLSLVAGQTVTPANGSAFSRRVMGARLENSFSPELTLGLNYVKTYDDISSIANAGTLSAADNDMVTIDGNWRGTMMGRAPLTLRGEFGLGTFDTNTRDATAGSRSRGVRLDAFTQLGIWGVQGYFEKTGAGFQPLSGSAAANRAIYRLDTRAPLTPHVFVSLSYENSTDNVSGTQSTTTTLQSPRIMLSYTPVLSYRDLALDFSYQLRNQRADDNTRNEQRDFTQFGVRHRIGGLRIQFGLDAAVNRDAVTSANELRSGGTTISFMPAMPLSLSALRFVPAALYGVSLTPGISWRTAQDIQPGSGATTTNLTTQVSLAASALTLGYAQIIYQLTDATRATGQGSHLAAVGIDATYRFPRSFGLDSLNLSFRTRGFKDSITAQDFSENTFQLGVRYIL